MFGKLLTVVLSVLLSLTTLFGQTAEELITKNLASRGDTSSLTDLNSIKISAAQAASGMKVNMLYSRKGENIRFETNMMGQKSVLGMFNDTLWQEQGGNVQVIPSEYKEGILPQLKQVESFIHGPFVKEKDDITYEYSGEVEEDGRAAYTIKIIKEDDETESYLYIDKNNFEAFKIWAQVPGQDGNFTDVEMSFKDFKKVEPAKFAFPHVIEITAGDQGSTTIEIEKIELNPELNDDIFKKPVSEESKQ